MDAAGVYKVCAVIFVEVFKIRDVRETVRVELTAFGSKVGLNMTSNSVTFSSHPFFASISAAWARISACGVRDAATVTVPPSLAQLPTLPPSITRLSS